MSLLPFRQGQDKAGVPSNVGGFGFGAPASHGGRVLEGEGHIQGLSDPFFSAEGSPSALYPLRPSPNSYYDSVLSWPMHGQSDTFLKESIR